MKRLRSLLLLVFALAVPAAALAQKGPPERGDGREHRGPVEMLLRDRAELGLSEDQVQRLQVVKRQMEEKNRPMVTELLRIRREVDFPQRTRPEEMTPAQREAFQRHIEQARPLLDQIHRNNREAMKSVGDILTAEQKAKIRVKIEERDKGRDGRRRGDRGV